MMLTIWFPAWLSFPFKDGNTKTVRQIPCASLICKIAATHSGSENHFMARVVADPV